MLNYRGGDHQNADSNATAAAKEARAEGEKIRREVAAKVAGRGSRRV